jgi:hypothetical protein
MKGWGGEQLQWRCIGEGEDLGRDADFSAPAAKWAACGRNDDLWVVETNKQQQMQPQVLRLAHSRVAQDDKSLEWVNS